jgi:hypothetical protein
MELLVTHPRTPETLHFKLTSGSWHPQLIHAEQELSRMLNAYTLAVSKQKQLVNYFGPLLRNNRGWELHTSKREERNKEFSILRHPAFQYCGDTSHNYTIYNAIHSHRSLRNEKQYLMQNADHLYEELDKRFNLSKDKDFERVSFNAPTPPHPILKDLSSYTCWQTCLNCNKTGHKSHECYERDPRNMYLYPPTGGYKDGIIPTSWLYKFRRRTNEDIDKDNIIGRSKFISGYELHNAPKWQCFWLYDEKLPIPTEVLHQYESLYGTNVENISSTENIEDIEEETVRLRMSHSPPRRRVNI